MIFAEHSPLDWIVTAAEEPRFSQNTLIASRRAALKLIAWAGAEAQPSRPCLKKAQGCSTRRRLAVGARLTTSRLEQPSRCFTTSWVREIRSLNAGLLNARLRTKATLSHRLAIGQLSRELRHDRCSYFGHLTSSPHCSLFYRLSISRVGASLDEQGRPSFQLPQNSGSSRPPIFLRLIC